MPFPYEPIRRIFHRFQNVPASCEHSLKLEILFGKITHLSNPKVRKMSVRGLCGNENSAFHSGSFFYFLIELRFNVIVNVRI